MPQSTTSTASQQAATLITRLAGDDRAVLAAVHELAGLPTLAAAERLRSDGWSPELVAAAMTQHRLRQRAQADLGERAEQLFFTDTGWQQATRWRVAQRHAQRFVDAGVPLVADLGCGLGVDSRAFAEAGLGVLAVERDAETAACVRANLAPFQRARVLQADVTSLFGDGLPDGVTAADGVFFDPARRTSSGKRVFDPHQADPPLSLVLEVAGRVAAAGAKLAPGVQHELIPEQAQAQWISVDGDVVEAALWLGAARRSDEARFSALLLRGDTELLVGAVEDDPVVRPVGEFLFEPDGAVIRAGALGTVSAALGAGLLDETIAYLTADRVGDDPLVGAATGYRVLDVFGFSLKGLRQYLRQRGVGSLTIKKRGTAVVPEQLRTQLKLSGPNRATIVLTRVAGRQSVLLVEPL